MKFTTVTIPATGSTSFGTASIEFVRGVLEAHPSNAGIIYVKRSTDAGNGYPFAAGATLEITNQDDLSHYVVSGVVGGRMAAAYEED